MLKIAGLFILAAVLYGVVHDQITARVCVEYFTIAQPTLVASTSPTVLGLVWGVVAAWWPGATAGLAISCAAREGPWPKLSWRYFGRPALALAAWITSGEVHGGRLGPSSFLRSGRAREHCNRPTGPTNPPAAGACRSGTAVWVKTKPADQQLTFAADTGGV